MVRRARCSDSATARAICARAIGTGAANCVASASSVALSAAAPARWPRCARAIAAVERQPSQAAVGRRCRSRRMPTSTASVCASWKRPSPSSRRARACSKPVRPGMRRESRSSSLSRRTACPSSNAPRSASAQTSTRIAPAATADSSRPSSSASRASRSASAVSPVRRLSSASYQTVAATSERESSAIARSRRASIAALAPFTRSVMIKTTTQRW